METWAPVPTATWQAFMPAMPAPRMTTFAGRTPEAPERSTPRPPFCAWRHHAPTCTASRPAVSLIGARGGDLAGRRGERHRAVVGLQGLVGERADAPLEQHARELGVGGEVEVRE